MSQSNRRASDTKSDGNTSTDTFDCASNSQSPESSPRHALIPLLAKNAWHTLNVILARSFGTRPRYLPVILLFLTSRCNLRCKMCGVCDLLHDQADDDELTTDEWKAVIDSAAKELGTTLAVISGGEALLRQDVFDLARHATDAGISIHFCTNALLLSEEAMFKLRDSGATTVSFSLDGPDAPTHEFLRGSNTFPPALNSLRRFREIAPNIKIGINFVITRHNYHSMVEMVGFAESLGVNQIKFAPIHMNLLHRRKKAEEYGDLIFQPEDMSSLKHELQRLRDVCKKSYLITTSEAFFEGIPDLYVSPRHIRCYAGYAICSINPAGYVAPCSDMDSVFNVREQRLAQIWRDPEFQKLREQVHSCTSPCWDTAYTELSLWLRPRSLFLQLLRNWRDIRFYYGSRRR